MESMCFFFKENNIVLFLRWHCEKELNRNFLYSETAFLAFHLTKWSAEMTDRGLAKEIHDRIFMILNGEISTLIVEQ